MKERSSNLELFRIIVMLAIIAHHYVVNSGMIGCAVDDNTPRALFALLFGAWGQIGINCFVLITGWFMCTSQISLRKFLKVFLTWKTYYWLFFVIFALTGHQKVGLRSLVHLLWPFSSVGANFTGCFLLFYLFIPFLNKLIHTLSEKEHRYLMLLSLGIYSVIGSIPMMRVTMNYVSWFMVLYVVASYMRLHGEKVIDRFSRFTPILLLSLVIACGSVLLGHWLHLHRGLDTVYYFVADSNKALAVAVSVLAFLTFKNLSIPQNRFINTVAGTTFGILCIHANSDAMRTFLWQDLCKNAHMYQTSPYFVLHTFGVVLAVFAVCSCIELVRQRVLEERLLNAIEALFRRSGA